MPGLILSEMKMDLSVHIQQYSCDIIIIIKIIIKYRQKTGLIVRSSTEFGNILRKCYRTILPKLGFTLESPT